MMDEYLKLFEVYETFNNQILIIKSWSVTVGVAALMAAYSAPLSGYGRLSVLIAAISVVPFWALDALWNQYQDAHLARLTELEECAANSAKTCLDMQIVSSWQTSYQDQPFRGWLDQMFQGDVLLIHFPLVAVGVALAAFWPPGPERP